MLFILANKQNWILSMNYCIIACEYTYIHIYFHIYIFIEFFTYVHTQQVKCICIMYSRTKQIRKLYFVGLHMYIYVIDVCTYTYMYLYIDVCKHIYIYTYRVRKAIIGNCSQNKNYKNSTVSCHRQCKWFIFTCIKPQNKNNLVQLSKSIHVNILVLQNHKFPTRRCI